ncbi:TPA: OFA family MFS transporter [Salmonella enterica]|uniref:L-lactate MFS transporter n=1 Tax=Salmonella enterica TaxID=28901 RepID=UPI000B9FB5C2|nr:OFA family MFS transporter [Salmonella enterica]EAB6497813.1 MFS transporter [Salmonella enterica subsp. enterica]EBG7016090.1 OFA family MFS transporter [Salmonella enterica subsp. enterica serovar Heidelberg]EBG9323426.1 OFA family MFS transporter [Salmonella enterica subsp. enterica serovar Saintpaul]EBM0758492.1 OFA family MFS transporter [Salmonella enterica subsp. enterica serovar Muenchen]EBS6505518.1 MFS transporter [Salmonella enterica subsp. enterica serovar Infantis]EBV2813023.1
MKNRWLIAAAAVGIHISLGSVYAWSVFKKPFMDSFGWSDFEAGLPFGLAIFLLGISAAVMGNIVERRGSRFSGVLSALMWTAGLLGAGFATSGALTDNTLRLWILLISSAVGGIGLGIGYVTPISTLMKWFPERQGLATGLAIMGFGFGAFLGGPIMTWIISVEGISFTFYLLGCVYCLIIIVSACYLSPPPEKWTTSGMKNPEIPTVLPTKGIIPMQANEAVRTPYFYGLWLMMFINITCGIAVISVASPMAQEATGISALSAGTLVGMIGLLNGVGRILWASFSDIIGRPNTYITFFILQTFAFRLLPSMNEIVLFEATLLLIITCYGGGFSTLPAYIGDLFGLRQISTIHGYVLTAWAMAGLVGSTLSSVIRQNTGSYNAMMQVFSSILAVAFTISVLMKLFINRRFRKNTMISM